MNDSVATPPVVAEFQPLYAQVKNLLVKRIGSGAWRPGELLPSEFELAAEYNVSQGTVRKAMMALEADRLIVRRQGRGTYVARHSSDDTLFHFFRMVGLDDRRLTPSSVVLRQCTQRSTPEQATLLSVAAGEMLHAIVRVRHIDGVPAISERIFVPVGLMPNLKVKLSEEMDEEMYVIYQDRFGISIARATERLAAIAATAEDALHLRLEVNAPLLQICRVAHDVNGRAIELRVSRCNTTHTRYAAEVN
jgi:GntR family transcriptional regulator